MDALGRFIYSGFYAITICYARFNKNYKKENIQMKFIACADLHFTDKTPRNRVDDYWAVQINKFKQIIEIADENEADIIVAGDVFDSTKVPYRITKSIMEIIQQSESTFYMVPGQHDLNYHVSGLHNTPLGILSTLDNVTILSSEVKTEITSGIEDVSLIGAGWDEEPKEKAHIIVMHRMITYKKPLWPGQEDYTTAMALLKKYPWATFIISGDNHKPHYLSVNDKNNNYRYQINCGSLMRKSKDQMTYLPAVHLIDTKLNEIKAIHLKINDSVFDLLKIEQEEIQQEIKNQAQEDIETFVKSLDMAEETKPRFENILQRVIKEVKPNTDVIKIINNLMESIKI